MRRRAPKVYEKMRYTSIDISKTLVDAQSARVRAGGHGKGVHTAVVGDATTVEAWGATKDEACFVIALEVLDNLPHDRVWRPTRGEEGGRRRSCRKIRRLGRSRSETRRWRTR